MPCRVIGGQGLDFDHMKSNRVDLVASKHELCLLYHSMVSAGYVIIYFSFQCADMKSLGTWHLELSTVRICT